MFKYIFLAILVGAALLPSFFVAAQVPDEGTAWYRSIAVNGFVSTAFTWNFNKPPDHVTPFRVFDGRANSLSVDAAELCIRKDVAGSGDAGFRIDLVGGSSVPRIARSSGLNSGDIDIQQMSLSYIAPLGNGLRIDVGKFTTHMGYELIEGWDGFNDNYSRSFLFGYAVPFTHTGVKVSYPFSSGVSAALLAVNGWDNAVDNNDSKTLGGQVYLAPFEGLAMYANAVYGPERDGNNADNRMVADFCATYAISGFGTIGANVDFGSEPHAAAENIDASWTGVAGYLRVHVMKSFAVALRGEIFNDAKGVRTGVEQKLTEFTVTPELRAGGNLVFRADLRLDQSNKEVFVKDGQPAKSQFTIGLNALVSF